MDKIIYHSSSDQSIYPNKTLVPMMAQSSENYAPSINHGGFPYAPLRSLSYSYPPFQTRTQHQPPLLPLPITTPYTALNRGMSCPPANRRINNRTKYQSFTPKKPKPAVTTTKTGGFRKESVKRLGPDPKDLPKVVYRDLSSSISDKIKINDVKDNSPASDLVMFNISPPPSSLPLPTFFLRPRFSCKAEAATVDVDVGATDSLRRMLRLR